MKLNYKSREQKVECKKCKGRKFKIVRTHGNKSKGYKVCKRCGALIK